MYSGSANSFGISKPAPDSKELYFHLLCRRRHCDVNIGLENYDDLNDELSSFLVKAGEWITIEREWKVGNREYVIILLLIPKVGMSFM